ncbi:MAG: hypothetical protein H0W62_13880 [Chitinophagales bacterium]|nr:hypothetical protein [Chitinophagales bacterium]
MRLILLLTFLSVAITDACTKNVLSSSTKITDNLVGCWKFSLEKNDSGRVTRVFRTGDPKWAAWPEQYCFIAPDSITYSSGGVDAMPVRFMSGTYSQKVQSDNGHKLISISFSTDTESKDAMEKELWFIQDTLCLKTTGQNVTDYYVHQ